MPLDLPMEHERRFILERSQAEAFVAAVEPQVTIEVYDLERPVAYTRTTYLDTENLEYFRTCDTAVASRLRVREYAGRPAARGTVPVLTSTCSLELKISRGTTRTKARFSAPSNVVGDVLEGLLPAETLWGETLSRSEPYGTIQQRLLDGLLWPVLTTWYHRASLAADAGRVRITLDEGIAFCRPVPIGAAGTPAEPPSVVEYGPGRMLEVKYTGDEPEWLSRALAPLSEDLAFSKFKVGTEAILRADGGVAQRRSTSLVAVPGNLRAESR